MRTRFYQANHVLFIYRRITNSAAPAIHDRSGNDTAFCWHSTTRLALHYEAEAHGGEKYEPKADRLSTVDTRFLLVGQYGHMMFDCHLPNYVGKQTQNFGYYTD